MVNHVHTRRASISATTWETQPVTTSRRIYDALRVSLTSVKMLTFFKLLTAGNGRLTPGRRVLTFHLVVYPARIALQIASSQSEKCRSPVPTAYSS